MPRVNRRGWRESMGGALYKNRQATHWRAVISAHPHRPGFGLYLHRWLSNRDQAEIWVERAKLALDFEPQRVGYMPDPEDTEQVEVTIAMDVDSAEEAMEMGDHALEVLR